jgi:hypothetical protein
MILKNLYHIIIINSLGVKQNYFLTGWQTCDALNQVMEMVTITKLLKVTKIA